MHHPFWRFTLVNMACKALETPRSSHYHDDVLVHVVYESLSANDVRYYIVYNSRCFMFSILVSVQKLHVFTEIRSQFTDCHTL